MNTGIAVLSQLTLYCVVWCSALSAPGCWPGRKPSLFCLSNDVCASVPVIAFPSLLSYARVGLILRMALFLPFKVLCGEMK